MEKTISTGAITTTRIREFRYDGDSRRRFLVRERDPDTFLPISNTWREYLGSNIHAEFEVDEQTGTADHDYDRSYTYDAIGNRTESDNGSNDPNDTLEAIYAPNDLNQYDSVRLDGEGGIRQGFFYDADGNLTEMFVGGDVDGDGDVDLTDLAKLTNNIGATCAAPGTLSPEEFARADFDHNCEIGLADQAVLLSNFGLPADSSTYVGYFWDAENRLVRVEPLAQPYQADWKKIVFDYDYRGRRVQKRVYEKASDTTWNSSPTTTRKFVWNGWLMLLELNASDQFVRRYTWGRDLGGDLESAGGIGGLLAVEDNNNTTSTTSDDLHYAFAYDANGNVGQVIDWAASSASNALKAKYEYDAHGNVVTSSGTYASRNPMRFSTKYWDAESGLGYWGYRYYDPRLGRWVSRDPIEEAGGYNIHMFVHNAPTIRIDSHGLYVPGKTEAQQAWEYLGACKAAAIFANSKAAAEIAKNEFPNDAQKEDSYRHCLWNCFNVTDTQCGGITAAEAKWAADQHEEYRTMNPRRWPEPRHSRETYKDYYNNHKGRSFGEACKAEANTMTPCSALSIAKHVWDCCKGKCRKGIVNGDLIDTPADPPKGWVLPVPSVGTQPAIE